MDDAIIKITFEDQIRLKRLIMDKDYDDAMKWAKEVLSRIELSKNKSMKNHLNK